jgi:DNA-binding HxlR family transcriptional regulator
MRFNEIQKENPKINERVLSRTLRELEKENLIYRKPFQKNPPHVEYGLTPLGRSLGPSLQSLCKWAMQNGWQA